MPGTTARMIARIAALTFGVSGLTAITEPPTAAAAPTVTRVASNLTIPWDVTWIGTTMLINERSGRLWSLRPGGQPQRITLTLPRLHAKSEGGMLGMVADPWAAVTKTFYTCMSVANADSSPRDVQVWKWQLSSPTSASKVRTLLTGIPIGTGRHNGCRLRVRAESRRVSRLYIGTGDAAQGNNPQNLQSLGGKVLRINSDGSVPTGNPFVDRGGNAAYVYSYGHRNVQGLAVQPGTGKLWAVEHGSTRDDEVNTIERGANYGWSPVPGYDESVPMTDLTRFPDAEVAHWSSGSPTVATSGATFLTGSHWAPGTGTSPSPYSRGKAFCCFNQPRPAASPWSPRLQPTTAGSAQFNRDPTARCTSPRPTAAATTGCTS